MEILNLFFLFFIFFKTVNSKSTSQSSQDILQSNKTPKPETKTVVETKSEERCDMDPGDSVNQQFKDYVQKFNESESGQFLKDLMSNETVSKFSKPITNLLEKVDKEHVDDLNKVATEPYSKTWNLVNLILSALYTVVLAYLTIMNPLSTYTTLTISSFVLVSIVMGLCHDLVQLWVVAVVGIVGDLVVWLLLSLLDNVKRRQICLLSICMVFSKMVYDLHAMLPFEFISPNYSGMAGIIVNFVFRSNNFMFLRLTYLVLLILLTCSLFMKLPSFVAGEPMELQEIDVGATIMKRLICFTTSLPAAGFCTQVYSGFRRMANPYGPLTYFVVPTKLRLDELGTYLGLLIWVALALVYYSFVKHSTENHLLTPPKKRRSWRAYTRTISRL